MPVDHGTEAYYILVIRNAANAELNQNHEVIGYPSTRTKANEEIRAAQARPEYRGHTLTYTESTCVAYEGAQDLRDIDGPPQPQRTDQEPGATDRGSVKTAKSPHPRKSPPN